MSDPLIPKIYETLLEMKQDFGGLKQVVSAHIADKNVHRGGKGEAGRRVFNLKLEHLVFGSIGLPSIGALLHWIAAHIK